VSVIRWTVHESPIGPLTLVMGPGGLTDLNFPGRMRVPGEAEKAPLPEVAEQLDAYFAGELRDFDLPVELRGTELQKAVWSRLREIPYGETISYGELAARVDSGLFDSGLFDSGLFDPGVEPWQRARAVGAVNGRNPVSIVVPCHRVIGADGSLTGYGGGLHRKRALLDLERNRQLAIL
jgi:methylated-DNA-[protein]-cysteine S-methyltransferase